MGFTFVLYSAKIIRIPKKYIPLMTNINIELVSCVTLNIYLIRYAPTPVLGSIESCFNLIFQSRYKSFPSGFRPFQLINVLINFDFAERYYRISYQVVNMTATTSGHLLRQIQPRLLAKVHHNVRTNFNLGSGIQTADNLNTRCVSYVEFD